MAHLALSFLGGFQVTLDAQPVTAFGTDKARSLLAYLAIEAARSHRRAELSAMLWPDAPQRKAAQNLRQTLLRLRRALQDPRDSASTPFLLVNGQEIGFNDRSDHALDVTRFRELLHACHRHSHRDAATCSVCHRWLVEAADLYQGDLLAGLAMSDSVAYEEWRLLLQEELHSLALEALTRLVGYYERGGQANLVERTARRLLALEPWSEEAHAHLMRALAHSGRPEAATNQYETYERTLAQELGLKPSAALARLREQIRAGELEQSATPAGSDGTVWQPGPGERRRVTVMACGRGALAESDELEDQLALCEAHCEGILGRRGGQRSLRQGDTCLVYFGYPTALEDSARQAVHAGLEIAAEPVKGVRAGIGIHTGTVIVGESRGPRWQDRDLVGSALERARDCQRLAKSGEVLITEDTQRLVQGAFDLQPLPSRVTGTTGQQLQSYRVSKSNDMPSRLDWLAQTQHLTAFVGHQEDLARLLACRDKAAQGRGQVVLLRGEPGIGKSRLIWELAQRTPIVGVSTAAMPGDLPPVLWLASRCQAHLQNTSLYPLLGLLEQLLGFKPSDSLDARRNKLEGILAWYGLASASIVWHLALFLGLATGQTEPTTVTASQRGQMTEAFAALLSRRAGEQPVVLVIEDLQWSDPSTLEWLNQFLAGQCAVRCLTLLTARPEFGSTRLEHIWDDRRWLQLDLGPLTAAESAQMVASLAGDSLPDARLTSQIVAQTDGVPLFLEELTKALLERLDAGDGADPLAAIPATLLDSLVARLDHLGPARQTAQWAAALGREFPYPVLQACVPYGAQRLQTDMERLIESGLVAPIEVTPQDMAPYLAIPYAVGDPPVWYGFRHALIREAAYSSLLSRTRQAHHRTIAEALTSRFVQVAQTQPEVVAQHYAGAGMASQAVDYWLIAGEQATAQGATQEARTAFDRALELIAPGDVDQRWRALCGRETVFDMQGERAAQEADLQSLLALAEACDNDTRRAEAYLRQSHIAGMQGRYHDTVPCADAAAAAARRAGNLTLELRAVAAKTQTLTILREMQAAGELVERMLGLLESGGNDPARALVLTVAAHYQLESGDLARAMQLQSDSLEAARQAGNHGLKLTIIANLGLVQAALGLYSQAQSTLTQGLARLEMLGDRRLYASCLRQLGSVHWACGDLELARKMVEQALQELAATGDSYGEAACQASMGQILEGTGDLTAAAAYLSQARATFAGLDIAPDRFETQALEARVVLAQGRRDEAFRLASEVWHYVREHGTDSIDSPSQLYLCLADVWEACESPSLGQAVTAGYRDLIGRAERISNATWRRSFLENVAENRALVERWDRARA